MSEANQTRACKVDLYHDKQHERTVIVPGTNVIPMDVFPARVSDDDIRTLLKTAKNSNMNMIRVWGGGYYLPDAFYDACDEMGLMVWQEAMFACSPYPRDEAFLEEVTFTCHGSVPAAVKSTLVSRTWAPSCYPDNSVRIDLRFGFSIFH